MDEFDEKISLYHTILELEDWLEIKHNPNILKQALDTMENYHCDLLRMRDEVAYSDLEDTEDETSIFNLFSELDKNKFSSCLNYMKKRLFFQSENSVKDISIRKYFVNFNYKIFCYIYALYFLIVLACLLNQRHFEWSQFIILDFICPLVVWGVIKVLTKKPEIKKICIPQGSNCILPTTQNPIYYTMKWDFEVWTKDKFMLIAPFYDIDKEKIVKACYFVSKSGERISVRFSDFIGELTPSQIFERKNELCVFLLSSKEYLLSTMNEHFDCVSLYEAFDF